MNARSVCTLGLWLAFSSLRAQTPFGQILGTVHDGSGLAVPEATVVVNNDGTGQQVKMQSDSSGDYVARALPPGQYTITVEKEGFKKAVRQGISLTAFQNARVDAVLEVGAVTQAVIVKGEADLVDTRTSTSGALIDDKRIVQLPLNGRNVVNFAILIPGVTRTAITSANEISFLQEAVNINGNRSYSTNMQLDGGSMYYSHRGQSMNMPPPDAVQEIKVVASGVTAEYGRGTAYLSLVTKSGTNELHGSAWNYFRNEALDARTFFAHSRAKLRFNQFGGTLGGPILKNRLFFFGSYQGLKNRQERSVTSAFPPTAAERNGDFTASNPAPIDPLDGQPFPGRIIPKSRFDPVSVKLLDRWPLPNDPSGRLSALSSAPINSDSIIGKFDFSAAQNDRLSFRYYFDFVRGTNPFPTVPATNIPGYGGPNSTDIQSVTLNHVRTWSPTLLSASRGSFSRFTYDESNEVRLTMADLGAQNFVNGGGEPRLPTTGITGRLTAGPGRDRQRVGDTYDFAQDWTWVRGAHELKWGAQVMRTSWWSTNNTDSNGTFSFNGSFSRNNMADFVLGRPVTLTQNSLELEVGHYFIPAFYVQDNWKVSSRLTLNLGLRWEIFTPWRSAVGALVLFKPGIQSRTFPTAPLGLVYQDDPEYNYNADRMNIGPRIGFAWDVFGNGKTAIRGGYAVSYDGQTAEGAVASNQPFTLVVNESNPGPLSNPYANTRNPFPYVVDPKNAKFVLPATMDGNMVTPFRAMYNQNLSLLVQRQLSPNWMAQAGYVGNLGRNLLLYSQANPAVYIPGNNSAGAPLSTTANTNARRIWAPLYSGFGVVNFDSNSSYHALQTMVVKRLSQGFTVVAHYTWSKAIDECSSEARCGQPQDPSSRAADRGRGDFDRRHASVLSYLYELPVFRNRRGFLHAAFARWQIAGINTFQSGTPITVRTGRDVSLKGIGLDRPDVFGNPNLSGLSKGDQIARFFDTSVFRENQPGRFGNSGRNIIRGPGAWNWDVSIQKAFAVTERHRVEFRADLFNALNHANLGNPAGNLNAPQTFGRINGTSSARVIQFALRYEF